MIKNNEEANQGKVEIKEEEISTKSNETLNSTDNEIKIINTKNLNNAQNDEKLNLQKCTETKVQHYKNIGSNIVFLNRFVFGPKEYIWILFLIMFAIAISYCLYIYSLRNFYPKIVYYILHIFFFLTEFFMLISYLTEPGIIPRNCPDYPIKEEDLKKKEFDFTPRIFTHRVCSTCNILRPPGASHCRQCDNCIMGLDHHCVFISNCIGKRNHKYFVFFLFFGSLFSILCAFFDIIVILYVFIIKGDKTLIPLFKGNFVLFILCILLIFFCIWLSQRIFVAYGSLIASGIVAVLIFLYLWYKYFIKDEQTPTYFNPFIVLVLPIAILFGVFVIKNFVSQICLISTGLTIKQRKSISEKISDIFFRFPDKPVKSEYNRVYTREEKIDNIWKFLCRKKEKSIIVPERDLIKK